METLVLEVVGETAFLKFDRASRRNGVTSTMVREMHAALEQITADTSLAVVVLTGNGTTFCPGADLKGRQESNDKPPDIPDPVVYQSARLLREMPQVTIAAVNGACAGAGMAWAVACDLRIAADTAKFATAFLDVGLPGELGLAWNLTHHLGGARARELSLLAGKIDAARALDIGLVSRVLEAATFAEESRAIALDLASQGVDAVRATKANLLGAERLSLAEFIDVETERQLDFFTGDRAVATSKRLAARGHAVSNGAAPSAVSGT